MRTDTNEIVQVRTDLFRGTNNLHAALRQMEALARSKPRVERAFVHIVISPDHDLTQPELIEALTLVEREHGLSSVLRAVVEHLKGERATHVHAVYPVVDPETGATARSHANFDRDELISRRLEIRFGERITPGPRIGQNVAELRRRGLHAEANHLAPYLPVQTENPLSRADRQQASRLEVKPMEWSARAYALFEDAGRDLNAFADRLEAAGLSAARGDRAVLLVDDATGYNLPLSRLLRREAKAAGRPFTVTEGQLTAAFPDARLLDQARDTGLERARAKAERQVEVERRTAVYEALADGDMDELEAFRVRRSNERKQDDARAQAQFQATLKARRDAIQMLYRERDAMRRRRVDRAFRAAHLFATPEMRRLAFALATAGVLMIGGSVMMALAGGFYAAHLLPSRTRARRLAIAAQGDRTADATARRAALDDAYRHSRNEVRSKTRQRRFSFDMIAKEDRLLAGFYADALLRTPKRHIDSAGAAKAAADALGLEITVGIARVLERGSPLQVRRLRHWYRGVAPSRRDEILAAALRRHAHGSQPEDRRSHQTESVAPLARSLQSSKTKKPRQKPRARHKAHGR